MDSLKNIGAIAASGMHAQGQRLKIVSENVANANSVAASPDEEPYRRKTISFAELVGDQGTSMVEVTEIGRDQSDFTLKYDPGHPAADKNGYIRMPNVNSILEMSNMREASRSYEANLNMFDTGRRMRAQLIDLLK